MAKNTTTTKTYRTAKGGKVTRTVSKSTPTFNERRMFREANRTRRALKNAQAENIRAIGDSTAKTATAIGTNVTTTEGLKYAEAKRAAKAFNEQNSENAMDAYYKVIQGSPEDAGTQQQGSTTRPKSSGSALD